MSDILSRNGALAASLLLLLSSSCSMEDGSDPGGDCGPEGSCNGNGNGNGAAVTPASLGAGGPVIGGGPTVILDGTPANGAPTNGKAVYTFTSSTAVRFQCSRDGGPFTACVSPQVVALKPGGNTDGLHSFSVRGLDKQGIAGPFVTRTFLFDTLAPTATITSADPADGAVSNDPSWTLAFSSNETGATFECRFDGGASSPCVSGSSSPQLDGLNTVVVRAIDAAGNVGPFSNEVSYTLDTRGPSLLNIVKPPTSNNGPRGFVTVSWTADEPATYVCTFPNVSTHVPCAGGSATVKEGFSTNFLDVIATDALGNQSSTSITWVVN